MLQKIARILTLNFDAKELRLNSGLEQEPEVLFDDNAAKDEADRFQSDRKSTRLNSSHAR